MGGAGARAAPAARGADRLRALGDRGADAHGQCDTGDDPRFRRLSRGALPDPLPGPRRARAGGRGGRAAQEGRHRRRRQRLPGSRSRRVGAAPLDVSGCRRAGDSALAATGTGHGAARRARPRAGASRRRWRADRRIRPRDAQSARLDGESAPAGAAALRAGVRRLAAASGSPRTTRRRSSVTANWRRTPRARIRPRSTTCRCSWRGAPPATTPAPNAPPPDSRRAPSRTIRTCFARRPAARARRRLLPQVVRESFAQLP